METLESEREIELREARLREREETVRALEGALRQRLAELHDPTETAAMRERLARSEERFRTLVTTSSALVWTATPDGRLQIESPAWKDLTGIQIDSDEPWSWLEVVHPDDRDGLREAWMQAVAERRCFEWEHRVRHHRGRWMWVRTRAAPILDGDRVREWIGRMSDITARKKIEEAREQFIGILGHDLRAPLNTVRIALDMLLRYDTLPEPHAKVVALALTSAARMEGLVRDMLDLARARLGGGIPLTRSRCDLRTIVEKSVAELRLGHEGRAIGVRCEGDLTGNWDPDRLEQVVSNLVSNAVQHGEDPVEVTVRSAGTEVTIEVFNHGSAIPKDMIPLLFEPFRHGDRASKGLGLGLYIVAEIVHAHGGTVGVRSDDDGTTFRVALPR